MNQYEQTISVLKALIATSNDGEFAFRAGARRARSAELAMTFACLADNCQQGARELQKCIVRLGGPAITNRSFATLWRRGALSAHRLRYGDDDLALLKVGRRVEEQAERDYREALEATLPPPVQALIERHYRGVRLNHVRVRDLLVMYQTIGPASYGDAANIVALRGAQARADHAAGTRAAPDDAPRERSSA